MSEHELRVVDVQNLDERRPRLYGHCTCGRWNANGYDCQACLERAHREHIDWDAEA